ncbi:hypothetical protein IQ238_24095 [Pleurocapsales cyanobacterium LEGE 06147]|nr:hypothetical protein [Pleurocapsales cyanobacterium LEGE 06147]
MSRNESQQEATEQFSFIYTLTYSRSVVKKREQLKDHLSPDTNAIANGKKNSLPQSPQSDFSLVIPSSAISPIALDFEQLERSLSSSLTCYSPVEPQEQQIDSQPNKRGINTYLDKIFFIFACGYLFFVVWWLIAGQNGQIPLFSWIKHHSEQQLSVSDANFLDYMERSLAVIDRKAEANKQQQTTDHSLTSELAAQIVYVPVYNAINALAPSSVATVTTPSSSEPLPPPPPPPSASVTPKTVSLPEAITATTTAELPPSPPPEPVSSSSSTNSVSSSVADYTLVGLLELGEKSAALFTVNGTTQRIWLGEKIDNTGWTLEAIANQKAQIRNQGQVRSLSIGEQF